MLRRRLGHADVFRRPRLANLAAARGHDEAKVQRQEMAELLTSEEVKIALSAARDWLKLAH